MNQYSQSLYDFFSPHSNSELAAPMEKYMKGHFEFFGIKSPERKLLTRAFIKENGLPQRSNLTEVVNDLWAFPERELQYVAIELMDKMKKTILEKDIELIEFLAVNKPWWDTVDFLSSNLAGNYFKLYPKKIEKKTKEWIISDDFWLNRMALLFQLKYKECELNKCSILIS